MSRKFLHITVLSLVITTSAVYSTDKYVEDDYYTAFTIWSEARGEPDEGQLLVGTTVYTRAAWSGRTPKQEVLKKNAFAWTSSAKQRETFEKMRASKNDQQFMDMLEMARTIRRGYKTKKQQMLTLFPYTHFYSVKIKQPAWARSATKQIVIGNHVFLQIND